MSLVGPSALDKAQGQRLCGFPGGKSLDKKTLFDDLMESHQQPKPMTPQQFVTNWQGVELSERSASQQHFIDLCELLGQPRPAAHDKTGEEYAFEHKVSVTDVASRGSKGEYGFVDAWWRGKFGWEYKRKGKHKDLTDAYRQLCQYRDALDNPPLLVVCDIARTEIHTSFTGYVKQKHTISLEEMTDPAKLDLLRRVFTDPYSFKPGLTTEAITQEVAEQFAGLARSLRNRGLDAQKAAHFLMKCMFCLFAEDVDLLPNRVFTRLVENCRNAPAQFKQSADQLFSAMRRGGVFGPEAIPFFNGGLFDDAPAIDLQTAELDVMRLAAKQDWGGVAPHIFGTLFERSLDPNARAQIGAVYTSREDILLIVDPVVVAPLRQEWAGVQQRVDSMIDQRRSAKVKDHKKFTKAIETILQDFAQRVATIRVLDPACGSGNFLYVVLQCLLDLEKEVVAFAAPLGLGLFPQVRPTQLLGIEINPFAAELARIVVWIGYLQWMRDNGFTSTRTPILDPLETIECRDAILDLSEVNRPRIAEWPHADYIVGNPPFAGRKWKRRLLARQFGPKYFETLEATYADALKKGVDLCCYWFELARRRVEVAPDVRVGLLATQGIRGGTNRMTLDRIKQSGDIFFAVSDHDWVLDDTMVHVSMVGFDSGKQKTRALDGERVDVINADLTSGVDATQAVKLASNVGKASQGVIPMGPFELSAAEAEALLIDVGNPNGRLNSEVVKQWANGGDMLNVRMVAFILDFGTMTKAEAAGFAAPFRYVTEHVLPQREKGETTEAVSSFWQHWRPRPKLVRTIRAIPEHRFIVTPRHSKHRIFLFVEAPVLPSDATVAIARGDYYCFGVLLSSLHHIWSLRNGTQVREEDSGKRYSHTFTFETFPFPWPLGTEDAKSEAVRRVEEAAKALSDQRDEWMNPSQIKLDIEAAVSVTDVPLGTRDTVRRLRTLVAEAADPRVAGRTWTELYNEYPEWLRIAHEDLDRAVLGAYRAADPAGEWPEEWIASFNIAKGQSGSEGYGVFAPVVEEAVAGRLLALNMKQGRRPETA